MSKIALTPNASGTGTLTVAAPNTNTDRTLTLPDVTTTLVGTDASQTLTNKSIAASQLTGALPAIDGSALTGIATGSLTLLGTLTTTSGTTQTLSGLTLTSYKQMQLVFTGVSNTASFVQLRLNGINLTSMGSAGEFVRGFAFIDLSNGILGSCISYDGTFTGIGLSSGITTASTSVTFSVASGAFDAGSILIYGVK